MTINPIPAIKRIFGNVKQVARRAFYAAQVNRLSADWITTATSIIQDIRTGMKPLRTRARDLVQNNDIAKRYVNLVRTNVVGNKGFGLQVKSKTIAGKPDEPVNTEIETAFADWSKPIHCSVTGTLSFRGIQDLLMTYMPRDGEVFVRMVIDGGESKYGMQLQIIPPELIDEMLNKELPDGKYIRMGIEYNEFGKPLAYWIRKQTASAHIYGVLDFSNYERIPAREIIHLYLPEYANQGRGFSWMAQSMMRMRMLSGYEDATLVNARVTAAKAIYFYQEHPESGAQQFVGDTQDAAGNQLQSIEPGMVDMAPPGYKPFQVAPEFPSAQHEMFVRATLRSVASGLNVSYNMLANDLVGVNYSSIRAGLLDEREMWKVIQQWFVETFLDRVFDRWLSTAIMRQRFTFQMDQFERVNKPRWHGRTWAWVDPMRDVEAKILEVAAGFETSNKIIAEKGGDIVETYKQLKAEKDLAAELGLTLKVNESDAPSAPAASKPADDVDDADDDDDELDETTRAKQIARWFNVKKAAETVLATLEPSKKG